MWKKLFIPTETSPPYAHTHATFQLCEGQFLISDHFCFSYTASFAGVISFRAINITVWTKLCFFSDCLPRMPLLWTELISIFIFSHSGPVLLMYKKNSGVISDGMVGSLENMLSEASRLVLLFENFKNSDIDCVYYALFFQNTDLFCSYPDSKTFNIWAHG